MPAELLQGRDHEQRGEQQEHVESSSPPSHRSPLAQLKLWIPDQLCSFISDTSCAAYPQTTLFFTVKLSKILIINMDELWERRLMVLVFSPTSHPAEPITPQTAGTVLLPYTVSPQLPPTQHPVPRKPVPGQPAKESHRESRSRTVGITCTLTHMHGFT